MILVTALAIAGAAALSACGQKGDLYLPPAKPTKQEAPAAARPAPSLTPASAPAARP